MMIERRLTLYRLHLIDPKSGTIVRTHTFHAEDDEKAIRFGDIWAELAPMQLYNLRRLVKNWPAADEGEAR